MLLEELTDPTMRNNKFETPLDLAALYGRLEVVKMLLNAHPNLLSCNTKKHTPLHLAARNGHKAVVHVLLDAGMDSNYQVPGVSEWGWAVAGDWKAPPALLAEGALAEAEESFVSCWAVCAALGCSGRLPGGTRLLCMPQRLRRGQQSPRHGVRERNTLWPKLFCPAVL